LPARDDLESLVEGLIRKANLLRHCAVRGLQVFRDRSERPRYAPSGGRPVDLQPRPGRHARGPACRTGPIALSAAEPANRSRCLLEELQVCISRRATSPARASPPRGRGGPGGGAPGLGKSSSKRARISSSAAMASARVAGRAPWERSDVAAISIGGPLRDDD
jgi:hypothetical protein